MWHIAEKETFKCSILDRLGMVQILRILSSISSSKIDKTRGFHSNHSKSE